MKLDQLIAPLIKDMTDEQLREHVRSMRHNRTIVRPAAQAHKDRAEKKEAKQKSTKISKSLVAQIGSMSDADRLALIAQLEQESTNGTDEEARTEAPETE